MKPQISQISQKKRGRGNIPHGIKKIAVLLTLIVIFVGSADSLSWARKKPKINPKQIRQAIQEKRSRLQELQEKLHHEKVRLYHVNRKEEDISSQLCSTVDRLKDVGADMDDLYVRIKRLQIQLGILQENLQITKKKLLSHQRSMTLRLRDIYENGEINYLTALTDSESFSDFLNRLDFLSLIVREDLNLLSKIKAERASLNAQEKQFQNKYMKLVGFQQNLMEREKLLISLKERREYLLTEVQVQRHHIARNVMQLENLSAEEEKALQELIRLQQSLNARSGKKYAGSGSMNWPCGGYLSSPFGWRIHPIYRSYIFHTGVDIAAEYGTAIAAADSGIVIMASWYGGYGNAVVIDHGSGLSTLYGHCSVLYVRAGQQVSKGQVVALVGSTGNSTGPHLHFEVRQNGTPIDPRGKL
jgi:murein DD-endopeptidase MepM/ murein hydrolase activator NlpD